VSVLPLGQHISGITYEAEGIAEKTELEGLPVRVLRFNIRGHCQRLHENKNSKFRNLICFQQISVTLIEGSLKFLFLKVIFVWDRGCILFIYGFFNYAVDTSAYIALI
jgi:hypothetical protein